MGESASEKIKSGNRAENFLSSKALTFIEVFSEICKKNPNAIALMFKAGNNDFWSEISYKEYEIRVIKIAKTFIKLGLEEGGSVAVLAGNSVEWFLSFLGAIYAGARITGIYTSSSAETCQYILDNCKASILVVDSDAQLDKILKIRSELKNLKAIVQTSASPRTANSVYKWSEVEAMNTHDVEDVYQGRQARMTPDDCCCIVYTSGTTGNQKGVMLSHKTLIWNNQYIIESFNLQNENKEVFVTYLPLSHIAGILFGLVTPMLLAATIYFADDLALKNSLVNTLKEARPTFLFGVPRVLEKLQESASHKLAETGGAKKHLIEWAQITTLAYNLNRLAGKHQSTLKYMLSKPALNAIKADLGLDRIRTLIVGAAPTNLEIFEFFLSLDLQLLDSYGQTECSGCIVSNTVLQMKFGSVGKITSDVEIKIANPDEEGRGEVCCRGKMSFMGYLNDIEKTRETIDEEGWLHTGDIGFIDNDGFLFLCGRIKELLITSGGVNIPFAHIESVVKSECSAISNAFLIGDKRKFLTMLITLKTVVDGQGVPQDELAPESLTLMKELDLPYTLLSEIFKAGPDIKVTAAIQAAIDRANKKAASNPNRIQKFAILPNDFSIASGECSPTMKLKRHFVLEKYANVIEEFYH